MWLAELSERSGVAIPTIKYYRRLGLLPAGEPAGATRSRYDDSHLERLRLVRALVVVGGMSLERVREVLAVVDDPDASVGEAMGSAHRRLSPPPDSAPTGAARERVAALARRRRWRVDPDGPHGVAVAAALDAMAEAGAPLSEATLATYADAADAVARVDVASTASLGRQGAVARAVTGTVLGERVLLSLRRLAHEAAAR